MAKTSSIEKNNRRRKLAAQYAAKRKRLKAIANDLKTPGGRALRGAPQACRDAAQLARRRASATAARSRAARAATTASSRCAATSSAIWRARAASPAWSSRAGKGASTMAMNDPLGDMLTRIRNAQMRRRPKVVDAGFEPARPRPRRAREEGYIRGYARVELKGELPEFEIELKYYNGQPAIREIERVSKPGRRVYSPVQGSADGRQRPRRCDPLHAEGRDVGLARRAKRTSAARSSATSSKAAVPGCSRDATRFWNDHVAHR